MLAGTVCAVLFLSNLTTAGQLNWGIVAASALLTALAIGPLAQSSLGDSIGKWSRTAGMLGRVVLIAAVIASVWLVREVGGVSQSVLSGVASGVFLAVAVYTAVYVLSHGSVEGW